MELNDNPAPVDLSKLSIEHLMPQTPTEEWLEELDVDEETYMANLHRLGNLTLAAKPDNSKMSNQLWDYKNDILKSTGHLKMNMELLPIPKWTIKCIDERTEALIQRICTVFPYPDVDVTTTASSGVVDERTGLRVTVDHMFAQAKEIRKNSAYTTDNGEKGYILLSSKMYPEGDKEKFWFGYRLNRFEAVEQCSEQYCVLICRNKTTLIVCLPRTFIDEIKDGCNTSVDDEGNVKHYHLVIHKHTDGKVTLLLSKPYLKRIDISKYVVAEL
ncbi:MAG: HNH endonuclease family protein [Oscillospiraceae bacterium]